MPVGIIKLLEVIDIRRRQTQRFVGAGCFVEHGYQRVFEVAGGETERAQ